MADSLKELVYNAMSTAVACSAVQIMRLLPETDANLIEVRMALKELVMEDMATSELEDNLFKTYRRVVKGPGGNLA